MQIPTHHIDVLESQLFCITLTRPRKFSTPRNRVSAHHYSALPRLLWAAISSDFHDLWLCVTVAALISAVVQIPTHADTCRRRYIALNPNSQLTTFAERERERERLREKLSVISGITETPPHSEASHTLYITIQHTPTRENSMPIIKTYPHCSPPPRSCNRSFDLRHRPSPQPTVPRLL